MIKRGWLSSVFWADAGRYVGIPFEEKMGALTAELAAQMKEAEVLDREIKIPLAKVGCDLKEVR